MATHSDTTVANRTASYTVVFTVNLLPYISTPKVNENQTDATFAATRSTWIPVGGDGHHHGGAENRQFKHGDTITAYDEEAYYLKNKYVRSASNPYGVLDVVSETL